MAIPTIDFFHLAKHGEKEVLNLFDDITKGYKQWCPFKHNKENITDLGCYSTWPQIKDLSNLLDFYSTLFAYLEINPQEIKSLNEIINAIKNPISNPDLTIFKYNLEAIREFIKSYQKNFFEQAKKFTCLESERLGESIICFKNECYFSSIIMAVSAIEGRLHTIIRGKNKSLYQKYIEKAPIGEIIKLRDPNEFKKEEYVSIKEIIKNIIPEKHLSLIILLNNYRIFSAHPKIEKITFNIVNSIISLSFAFLLDDELQIPKEMCKKGRAPAY